MKHHYFLILFILTQCFGVQSQVYVNMCVTQPPPLVLSQGIINNESCLNSFNGSATVNVSGGKTPYTFSWNTIPSQSTQTASSLSAGVYIATVTDANNCSDTLSFFLNRNSNPVANFSSDTVCNGSSTQFTNTATTSSGSISSYAWDFGDGNPVSTLPNPSHVYANGGNFNVSLIVNNSYGCVDSITKQIEVYYTPVASFSHNDVCYGDTVYFTNTSTVNSSTSITSYLWDFDNGGPTSNLENPSNYYSISGTYNITFLITTIDGCSAIISNPVNTFDPPSSAFTFSNPCSLDSILFTNTTAGPTMGNVSNWLWDFGDGSALNSTILSPAHLYSSPGNYNATLISHSSNLNCADTTYNMITIYPSPTAEFASSNVCLNQPMNFNDLSIIANGNIINWLWNFGDATPISTLQNQSHTYTTQGTYNVTLAVSTNNGCFDSISKIVTVHPLPTAQFSSVNVCNGTPVSFSDGSQILATDTILSWDWNFDDGSPISSSQNPTHLYNSSGSYWVQLLVTSNFGCKDSITNTCTINPNPIVNFITNKKVGCEPLCVNFQDSSSVLTGTNTSWLWNFGDNSPSDFLQNTIHCYTNNTPFSTLNLTVTLTVTTDSGCVTTKSENDYITVYNTAIADFSVLPSTASITNPIISVINESNGAIFWYWNFGDNDTSSMSNPGPHTYADTGTYTITMVASTLFNCTDTAHKTVIIEPDFLFYIPNAFTPDDDGVNDSFSGKGVFIKEYEMRIFDRWGNLIYHTIDINKPWEGKTRNGKEILKTDVFVYSINIIDFNMKIHNYKGIVTLIK